MKSNNKSDVNINFDYNRGFINSISLLISLFFAVVVVYLISLIPVDTDITKYEGILLPGVLEYCCPEPLEFIQYIATIVTLPLSYLIVNDILCKKVKLNKEKAAYHYNLLQFIIVFFIVIICVSSYLFMFDMFTYKDDLVITKNSFALFKYSYLPYWVIIEAITIIVINYFSKLKNKAIEKVIFFFVSAALLIYAFVRIASINYSAVKSEYLQHHFYAFWYPIYKVASGQTIGIEFKSIYGFYPYFIVPILKLFGGVTQNAFSIFIAICLCLIAIFYLSFCYCFIKNKILALVVGVAASIYGPFGVFYGLYYFQSTLLRSFFPALALFLITLHYISHKKATKTLISIASCIVLGLGVAFNIESGSIALIIWAGYLIFDKAFDYGFINKNTIVQIIKSIVSTLISFLIFVGFVELVTYKRNGTLLDKDTILFGINAFEGTGFNMIQIYFGIWILFAIVFGLGVICVIPYITKYREKALSKANLTGLFSISITGIGAFSYFIGRSFPTNALSFFPQLVICCGFLIEYYKNKNLEVNPQLKQIKELFKNPYTAKNAVKTGLLYFLVSVGIFTSVFEINYSFGSYFKDNIINPDDNNVVETAQLIQDWANANNNGEIPHLLTYYSIFLDEKLDIEAEEDVCEQIDWFYLENAYTYVDYINDNNETFIIDDYAVEQLSECYSDELNEALANYTLEATLSYSNRDYEPGELYVYSPVESNK